MAFLFRKYLILSIQKSRSYSLLTKKKCEYIRQWTTKKENDPRNDHSEIPDTETFMTIGAGTKELPNEISSFFDYKIVGCVCEKDGTTDWMLLSKGELHRCKCGYWYSLVLKPVV